MAASAVHAGHGSLNRTAFLATVHCLTGCAIGEILGMILGLSLGWGTALTIVVSIALAFVFGYTLTLIPLVRSGIALRSALALAVASDTISIALMEVIDNALMMVIPGAMAAGPLTLLFWGSMAASLLLAGAAAFPLNRWLIARGRGHAVVHRSMTDPPANAQTAGHGEHAVHHSMHGPNMRHLAVVLWGLISLAGPLMHAQPHALYDVTLQTNPATPTAGGSVELRLKVTGRDGLPITAFDEVHERPLHLIIVSRDLSAFWHVHPAADGPGTFRVSHLFASGGAYRLFADLRPAGHEARVVSLPLTVQGPSSAALPLGADRSVFVSSKEGLQIELRTAQRPIAGAPATLAFAVTDTHDGSPVTDLEPYLGSRMHVIIVRSESLDLLHVHQAEPRQRAQGGGHHAEHSSPVAAGDALIIAESQFPSAGRYKIWTQFQRHGRVITASFVLTVRASG